MVSELALFGQRAKLSTLDNDGSGLIVVSMTEIVDKACVDSSYG